MAQKTITKVGKIIEVGIDSDEESRQGSTPCFATITIGDEEYTFHFQEIKTVRSLGQALYGPVTVSLTYDDGLES